MSIDETILSAYHPQSNGLTERFNQTLITQLMKSVNKEQNNLDEYLQPIAFAYRTNQQVSVRYTPFQLIFGVPAKLPCDFQESSVPSDILEPRLNINSRIEYITAVFVGLRQAATQ